MSSSTLSAIDVERLAKRYGLTVTGLCRAAAIGRATFYRWHKGGDINLQTYDKLLTAIGNARDGERNG